MPRNKMQDLRDHLFETMEALKDSEKPMDIDRAKAVCQVAEKLIDTARVEVKFMEATGANVQGDFFEKSQPRLNSGKANGGIS